MIETKKVILYGSESNCCGCNACANICPKDAIQMEDNTYGFTYPLINETLCIQCNLCKKVCAYQNSSISTLSHQVAYASMAKQHGIISKSASGGVFMVVAKRVIERGGSVFGCSLEYEEGKLIPKHIEVTEREQLKKLQGSKYVQSSIGDTYQLAKKRLEEDRWVLFSGTPCQIGGLQGFLRKSYDKLLTMDLVCHGVPSRTLFEDYLEYLQKEYKIKIKGLMFRDKSKGWGYNGRIDYQKGNQINKKKVIHTSISSYYKLFLMSAIFRDSCYSCKYANINRISDITIGDYWGIKKEHPDYLIQNGGKLDCKKGISGIIVNTEKGKQWIELCQDEIVLYNSTVQQIAKHNAQLNKPSHIPSERQNIMELYKEKGYGGIENWYNEQLGIKKYLLILWGCIPSGIQSVFKRILKDE